MKKVVLLFVLVFAIGVFASPVNAKVVDADFSKVSVVVDDNTSSPEGDKKGEKAKTEKAEKSSGCAGEKAASKENSAGCSGEKAAAKESPCCAGEKSASKESTGCGGEKSAQVPANKK